MSKKTKYQVITDWLFQIGTLRKDQKQKFVNQMEATLQEYDFKKVTKYFHGGRKYTMAVRFEKPTENNECKWIEIVFDKYGKQQFQIHMGVTITEAPYNHILKGNLVRKKRQYYYFWGARWYSLLRNVAWLNALRNVRKCIPQIIEYLETGKLGNNIRDFESGAS